MPLQQNVNLQDMSQGIDRITSILQQQSQPRAMSPLEPQASSVPLNIQQALLSASMDVGRGGGSFIQNLQNYENTSLNRERQNRQDILGAYDAKLKLGDRQTKALDDKIKMFVGDDADAKSTILQELHNLPEDIDPTNADTYIKIAGIAKKHGLTNVERQLKLEKERADIERSKSLSSGIGAGGATGALADRLIASGVDPLQALLIAKSGIDRGMTINQSTGQLEPMEGFLDIAGQKKEKEAFGSALGKSKGEKEGVNATKIIQAPIIEERLKQAEKLLPQSTGGGLETSGRDVAAYFGKATKGSEADAQLDIISAELVSNVPRMEGPQSDRDTLLYKQAAGNLADSTKPRATRIAAIKTIREINNKYLDQNQNNSNINSLDDLLNAVQPTPSTKSTSNVVDYREYFK